MVIVFILIALGVALVIYDLGRRASNSNLERKIGSLRVEKEQVEAGAKELRKSYTEAVFRAETLEENLKKITHQKKSSEVRTGQIAEQMAPFLNEYPYSPSESKFLGQPVDFIVFSEDCIHFVEVKSGNSQLNKKQRQIRDQIEEGKVSFEICRIKGE